MEVVKSKTSISVWWSKIGKWQALATFVALVFYFIILYFTDNKEAATALTIVATFILVIILAALVAVDAALVAAISLAAAFTVSAVDAALVAAISLAAAFTVSAIAIVIVIVIAANDPTKEGVSKKNVWLSYVLAFILTLTPMLISILH